MAAPTSAHQAARRGVVLNVEREYQPDPARCVAAIVKLLTYRSSGEVTVANDSAAASRPLASALDATTPSPPDQENTRAPLEVNRRGPATKVDA